MAALRIAPDGGVVDPEPIPLYGLNSGIGSNWRVIWRSGGVARAATVDAAGVLQDPGGTALPGVVAGIAAGSGSGTDHLAWSDFFDNEYAVHRAVVNAGNEVLGSAEASTGTPRQNRADIADGYMLVYRGAQSGNVRVLAQSLDASGTPITAEPLELDSGTNLAGPGSPAVAWNGSVYLVSWGAPGGIYAQRRDVDGAETRGQRWPYLCLGR